MGLQPADELCISLISSGFLLVRTRSPLSPFGVCLLLGQPSYYWDMGKSYTRQPSKVKLVLGFLRCHIFVRDHLGLKTLPLWHDSPLAVCVQGLL